MRDDEHKRKGRGRSPDSVATRVYERVSRKDGRYWSMSDFDDLPTMAVAHALSRLAASGELQRVRKGLYYRPKMTAVGPSRPSGSAVVARSVDGPLHPSGLTAGSALGLTTQNPGLPEIAITESAAPAALDYAWVRTRRPRSREKLDPTEGALLELLRDRARFSDLGSEATAKRLKRLLRDPVVFQRLAKAARDEPPRVRAMLGALGELADAPGSDVQALRASLNPISKFDFGLLSELPNARDWQAK